MALRTDQIASRYEELLHAQHSDGALSCRSAALLEVKSLLLQALSSQQGKAYDMLLERGYLTSRELADELGIRINAASNTLNALMQYNLVAQSSPHFHPLLVRERPDLQGYPGYIWLLREKGDREWLKGFTS